MITEEVGKGGDEIDFEGKDKEAQGTGLSWMVLHKYSFYKLISYTF